jgi:hypothetical protein
MEYEAFIREWFRKKVRSVGVSGHKMKKSQNWICTLLRPNKDTESKKIHEFRKCVTPNAVEFLFMLVRSDHYACFKTERGVPWALFYTSPKNQRTDFYRILYVMPLPRSK